MKRRRGLYLEKLAVTFTGKNQEKPDWEGCRQKNTKKKKKGN